MWTVINYIHLSRTRRIYRILNRKRSMSQIEDISVRKGAWSCEEDVLLTRYIEKHGEGNWSHVPARAGLRRCRKSCRLRWLNYLRPNIKRGHFSADEVDMIIRLHNLLGNKYVIITSHACS
ncbi:hypothetical protein ZOSMA_79G00250 [Zostera marina]|uniref:Uncharacterized protein n=1 Tax=Zostera marina TaxID=29655 RepID=A0A0K9NN41_ZOSMR|nr:hypothetical protein ZOSMA_79G00250 [Zostera marina]